MAMRLFDPFEHLLALQNALETARTSDWMEGSTGGGGTYPPVNVFRQGDGFAIVAEIPGVEKSDINIEVKDNQVRISGRRSARENEDVSVHRRERVVGEFDRTIPFRPQIDPDGVKAEYRDGVLAIFLPRAQADKPRSVAIN